MSSVSDSPDPFIIFFLYISLNCKVYLHNVQQLSTQEARNCKFYICIR